MDPTLHLPGWSALGRDARLAAARDAVARLGRPFVPVGLERGVVLFEHEGDPFVFVPGGETRGGFVPGSFALSAEDVRFLAESGEFETEAAVREELAAVNASLASATSPPRTVRVGPMLVEQGPVAITETPVSSDDPAFARVVARFAAQEANHLAFEEDGRRLRAYRRYQRPGVIARLLGAAPEPSYEVHEQPTFGGLKAVLARDGFRLPTEDEWEWCAGEGRPGAFRWGDAVPVREEPPGQDGGEPARFEDHAFGLEIGGDPYACELCEGPVLKGGDGGTSWCGGEGTLRIWASLLTSRREAWKEGLPAIYRRVVPLG